MYFGEAKMCEANKILRALFTSYVLLRKTQSSVSLAADSPFQKGPYPCGGTKEEP